jgi:hypothetical protein
LSSNESTLFEYEVVNWPTTDLLAFKDFIVNYLDTTFGSTNAFEVYTGIGYERMLPIVYNELKKRGFNKPLTGCYHKAT